MPADRAALDALLARLEAGSGADRELDDTIATAFDQPGAGWTQLGHDEQRIEAFANGGCQLACYTASIDAAVALAERLYGRASAQWMLRQAANLAVARAMCVEVVRAA